MSIKIENTVTPSPEQWERIIMGARNPLNSWERYDSYTECEFGPCQSCQHDDHCSYWGNEFIIGPNDLSLLKKLAKAGTDHRKFMRMITVYADITAPLYWFKEFDTYKIGTVANSCSTMHKIHDRVFTFDDFSHEHLVSGCKVKIGDDYNDFVIYPGGVETLENTIIALNRFRRLYLETKDKTYWYQMIQLLPSSYNQKRTVLLNYEVLANIYKSRKNHKLDEWKELCEWIESLPYSELITGETKEVTK